MYKAKKPTKKEIISELRSFFGKDDKCKEYELSDGATLDWNDI